MSLVDKFLDCAISLENPVLNNRYKKQEKEKFIELLKQADKKLKRLEYLEKGNRS